MGLMETSPVPDPETAFDFFFLKGSVDSNKFSGLMQTSPVLDSGNVVVELCL